jgi:hypothetical protein
VNGNITVNGHYISGGSTPSAALGAAAGGSTGGGGGTGGSVSISGNDTFGTITVTTGTNPGSGVLSTITFGAAYGANPHVVLSPSNGVASNSQFYKGTVGTTSVQLDVNSIPFPSTVYMFDYFIGQ